VPTGEAALDTRRLTSFIAIVDLRSLSRAAERLGVSQPTLSNMVATLEAELETKLLIRSSLGVRPTGAGSLFYHHAQLICRQVNHASADIRVGAAELAGTVSVGLPISTASVFSLPLFTECRKRFPGIRLRILTMPSSLVLEML
ncbi:MAG: LysR family transcriptional regulator, partial [Acetobacteraceae bacterium]